MKKALTILFAAVTFATAVRAQISTEKVEQAVEVLQVKTEEANQGYEEIGYTVRNVSAKTVTDYILILTYRDAHGRSLGSLVSEHESWAPGRGRVVLQPGDEQSISESIPKSNIPEPENFAGVTIEVDFLLFADRTSWGPNRSGHAAALGRMEAGAELERKRLRKILSNGGTEALVEDLSQH